MLLVFLVQSLRFIRRKILLARLSRHLYPFFTPNQINKAIASYVAARFKSTEDGEQVRENLIRYFVEEVFNRKHFEFNYYMILSRPGMGKTSFFINLFWQYRYQLLKKDFKIKLVVLNHAAAFQTIEQCPQPDQTVLLLDGLDEVPEAIRDYRLYMDKLIWHTRNFARVLISCRTGFLPQEVERPKESKPISFVGEDSYQLMGKIYIDPFDETDVFTYLKKRLSLFEIKKRLKAQALHASMPYLFSRPLFLNYIGYILEKKEHQYTHINEVYTALFQKWIAAQPPRGSNPLEYRKRLHQLFVELAWDMYANWEEREGLWIPEQTLVVYQKNIGIEVEPWENSPLDVHPDGYFFFVHPSFVGYLVAWKSFFLQDSIPDIEFKGLSMAAICYHEFCWKAYENEFSQLRGYYRTLLNPEKRPLADIRPWELKDISRLYLYDYKGVDLRFLRGLKYLKGLYLYDAEYADLTPKLLEQLPHSDVYIYLVKDGETTVVEISSAPVALEVDGVRGVAYQWDPPRPLNLRLEPDPSKIFHARINGHRPSEAVLKLFNMDLKALPNETCKQIGDGSNAQGLTYQIYEQYAGFAELEVFNKMHIHLFPDGSKNILFCNTYTPTLLIQTLREIVERLVRIYGEDDYHQTEFNEDDEAQVEDGLWLGRKWAWGNTDSYAFPLHLYMDKPGNLNLTLFGVR